MAPLTRPNNQALSKKIATLQLELAPLVPLPSGPPHPAFPKTLLAFHLLTEDELDSIAHHYHQSTPGPWTQHYPELMNWDKEFLAKPRESLPGKKSVVGGGASAAEVDAALEADVSEKEFLETLMETVRDLRSATPPLSSPPTLKSSPEETATTSTTTDSSFGTHLTSPTSTRTSNPFAGLSDKDRIRIKRRKVGKFIGLVGMETPVEEIAGRIQASLDRAVERGREELRRNEEVMLRRTKMA